MPDVDLMQRYEDAYNRYKNRRISWVQKFHAVAKEIPHVKHPKNITEKSIQRLEKAVWPKFSERQKKEYRKEYERKYEEGLEGIYFPKPPYNPPTEKDFLRVPVEDVLPKTVPQTEAPEEPEEPVVSRDEIEAWINANIYSISEERENEGVKEFLEKLVLEAADAYGDYEGYLNHLEANADMLNKLAEEAIKYHKKDSLEKEEELCAVSEFATILNLGRPLTPSQAERLENEGWVSFDFND